MSDDALPDAAGPFDAQARAAANRRMIARLFAELDDEQLAQPSLCAGWTCRDVLGHLVMSVDLTFLQFLREMARDRGRSGRTSARLARTYGARPVHELVQRLDDLSDTALSPPGVGPEGPFADSCIHLRDVAIPLGLGASPPLEDWAHVLEFLTTRRARAAGFLPRGRLDGLALHASDIAWSGGSGAPVRGPAEALAMSVTGRSALLDQLTGAGAPVLRQRVLARRS